MCRSYGAIDLGLGGFYKYAAPTALNRATTPGKDLKSAQAARSPPAGGNRQKIVAADVRRIILNAE